MSLLSRIFDFQPNTVIRSGDIDSEFNQIIDLLSGVGTGKSIRIRNNDSSFAAARFDQLGSANVVEFFLGGVQVGKWDNFGNVQITKTNPRLQFVEGLKIFGLDVFNDDFRFTNDRLGTTWLRNNQLTDVCTFLNIPELPASNPTTDNQAVRKKYVDDKTTASWFYATAPPAVESVESVPRLIASESVLKIDKIRVVFGNGSHTASGALTWTFKRRNSAGVLQTDLGTITLDDTNNTKDQVYTSDIGDVTLNDGDQVYPLLTTRSGTITETNITVSLVG